MATRDSDNGRVRSTATERRRKAWPAALGLGLLLLLALGVEIHGEAAASGFGTSLSATPASGFVPLLVSFSVTVLSGSATSYNWTFGDGTYLNGSLGAYATPYHRYDTVGLFNASVAVHEGNLVSSSSLLVHVYAAPLTATIVAQPLSGFAPLTVDFVGSAAGGTGTYSLFNWSFGDGGVGSGLSLRYEFLRSGDFRVFFNVTDSSGTRSTAAIWLNVSPPVTVPTTKSSPRPLPLAWVGGGLAVGFVVAFTTAFWVHRRRRAPPTPLALSPPSIASSPSFTENGSMPPSGPPPPTIGSGVEAPAPLELSPGPPKATVPTPSVAPVAGPRGEGASREVLRLSQRIVIHLSELGRLGPDDVAPLGFSQLGMAERLQVKQNALTNVLRRLVAAGVLSEDVRHVRGRPRRLKVYRLTGRGEALARELRRPPGAGAAFSPRR